MNKLLNNKTIFHLDNFYVFNGDIMEKLKNLDDMYELMETINSSNYSNIKERINSFLKETINEENKKAIKCEHTCLEFRIIDAKC